MGTIITRKRQDGVETYLAQISIKRQGKVVFRENRTFERRSVAEAWMRRREKEVKQDPEAAAEEARANDPTLSDIIDVYIATSRKKIGKTKAQVLRTIAASPLGQVAGSKLKSQALVDYALSLSDGRHTSTVGNYMSHLASVMRVARPAFGYPVDVAAIDDARIALDRLGIISRSDERSRRPTREEMDKLLAHYSAKPFGSMTPMAHLTVFALYSARRQSEITRLRWEDYDADASRILVRDMKHPGEKWGNDVWTTLPPEAKEIIEMMPRDGELIFPYNSQTVSALHTRACQILGIEDLRFHDFRHEGVSRLFEMGWDIPRVAQVSGHRTWTSLKRYEHMRQTGDKWAGWGWRKALPAPKGTVVPFPRRGGPLAQALAG